MFNAVCIFYTALLAGVSLEALIRSNIAFKPPFLAPFSSTSPNNSFLIAFLAAFTLSSVASSKNNSPRCAYLSTAYIPKVLPKAIAAASYLEAPCCKASPYTSELDTIAI
nr:MAG TPA: hypothetical protein [Caudoviricetes sp.]